MALRGEQIKEILEATRALLQDERSRRSVFQLAFGNNHNILGRLNWSGPPDDFIVDAVTKLDNYGEFEGELALCTLLKTIRGQVGTDRQANIDRIIQDLTPGDRAAVSQDLTSRQQTGAVETLKLSGPQKQQLREALQGAFTRGRLEMMLREMMDLNLDDIDTESNYSEFVFKLIDFLDREDRLKELILAAREKNPRNQDLRAFAESCGL